MSTSTAVGHGTSWILDRCPPGATLLRIGLTAVVAFVCAMGLWEAAFGRIGPAFAEGPPDHIIGQIRLVMTHAIVVSYLIWATAYTLRRMDEVLVELEPQLANPASADVARVRSRRPWLMRAWAEFGILAAIFDVVLANLRGKVDQSEQRAEAVHEFTDLRESFDFDWIGEGNDESMGHGVASMLRDRSSIRVSQRVSNPRCLLGSRTDRVLEREATAS